MTTTRLPVIYGGPTVAGQEDTDSYKAYSIYEMMVNHPEQGRKVLRWHSVLARAAATKCELQARQGWTGHVDPLGYGANHQVRLYGYKLPDHYRLEANNIESLSHHGDGTPEQTFEGWLNSPGHRAHILGLNDFYAGQTNVGVGFYAGGEKEYYWCVISCPPEGA